jgi:hypothetical protein
LTITIQPVEIDGAFWVRLSMDDQEMRRHGSFSSADEAEAAAYQLAGICRGVFHQEVAIGGAYSRRWRRPTAGIAPDKGANEWVMSSI